MLLTVLGNNYTKMWSKLINILPIPTYDIFLFWNFNYIVYIIYKNT